MNKYLSLLSIALVWLNSSIASAEEAPVTDPIVSVANAAGFGIWKIYNTGEEIYIIDQKDKHYLIARSSKSNLFFTNSNSGNWFELRKEGTAESFLYTDKLDQSSTPFFESRHLTRIEEATAAQISSQLQLGRYGFGDKRFVVSEDSIIVSSITDIDENEVPFRTATLKKNANGLIHSGTVTTSPFDSTFTLDENGTPFLTLGDCLASYSSTTGEVIIPCLSIDGSAPVYRVKQQQIPNTLTFEVDANDITQVQ